jgi:hypothetical protein
VPASSGIWRPTSTFAKAWLESQRYDVTAADREEALARLRETIPDLVLLEPVHEVVGLR